MANIDGSNQERVNLPDGCDEIHTFDLSPDGGRVAFMCPNADSMDASLYVLHIADQSFTLISDGVPFGKAYFAPESDRLAYVATDYSLHTVKVDGSLDEKWGAQPNTLFAGWTPDGRIAFEGFGPCEPEPRAFCHSQTVILDLVSGDRVNLLDIKSLGAWSPDGRYVLAWTDISSEGETQSPWETVLINLATGERRRIFVADLDVNPALWFRDGRSFLVSANKSPGEDTEGNCSSWRIDVSDTNSPSEFLRGICGPAYFTLDGSYLYAGPRLRGPPDHGMTIYRLDLRNGDITDVIKEVVEADSYEPLP